MLGLSAALTLAITPCPPSARCAGDETLLVISANEERAAAALDAGHAAREHFAAVFGETPVPTAIVEDIALYPGITLDLQAAGYVVKPWISPGAMRAALEAQLRPALQASMADASPEAVETVVQSAVERRLGQNEQIRHGEAIIAHELGHIWMIHAFDWPDTGVPDQRSYGAAAAPDWMDETAAVLMETGTLTEERRDGLCARLPGHMESTLANYFTMEHPMINMAREAAAQRDAALAASGGDQSAPQIMMITREVRTGDDALMTDAGYYYSLTRAFVDYVTVRTGSPAVFASLARTLAGGQTLDSWLADGVTGLPGSQADLIGGLGEYIVEQCST